MRRSPGQAPEPGPRCAIKSALRTTEGRSALSSGAIYPVVLTMSPRLGFGDATIGEMPVKVRMKDYVVNDNDNGSFTLHAKAGVEISRNCP